MTDNDVAARGTTDEATLRDRVAADPAYGAYLLLRLGFVVLPLLMGLDKFFNLMADWPDYLAPWIVDIIPVDAETAMLAVGVIEILAAVMIAIRARYAAYVVAAWLAGIILNLLTYPGFYDVALRDVGLLVAALTLALLARKYDVPSGDVGTRATPQLH